MKNIKYIIFIYSIIVLNIGASQIGKSSESFLSVEEVVKAKEVSTSVISPNGKYIGYIVRIPRSKYEAPGPAYTELWIVQIDEGVHRKLLNRLISPKNPRWSNDSLHIYYLGKQSGHYNIYVINIIDAEIIKISSFPSSVRNYKLSNNGEYIACIVTDLPKSNLPGHDHIIVGEYNRFHRLYIIDVELKQTSILLTEDIAVWDMIWSSQSDMLLLQISKKPTTDDYVMFKEIYILNIHNGNKNKLVDTEGKLSKMAWSPDGNHIAYLGAINKNDPTHGTIYLVSLRDRMPINISNNYYGTVEWIYWIDELTILFIGIENQNSVIRTISIDGKLSDPINFQGKEILSINILKDGSFSSIISTSYHPPELYYGNINVESIHRKTHLNQDLDKYWFGEFIEVEWESRDGYTIEGLLMKPKHYTKGVRYPLVVQVHGGPESAYTFGWNLSYNRWAQLLAQRGFLVFKPNYRGSIGRGAKFAMLSRGDIGGGDLDDIIDGIFYLIELGIVDKNRIGIGGASYGGYLSALAVTKYSEIFSAAVVFAGVSNRISAIGTTDLHHEFSIVHLGFYIYKDYEFVWERSPLFYIEYAQTPTLIGHGGIDQRVNLGQSLELFHALNYKGIDTSLVIYPNAGHGLSTTPNKIDFIERVLWWFEKYLN